MNVDVCLSPDLLTRYDLEGKVVVVTDILRATSCMVAGMGTGVASITPFESLELCLEMKGKGYVIAGERGGQKVEGFDIGNSPYSYMSEEMKGADVAVTTTNGTRAIVASSAADIVVIGAFLNLSPVVSYCKQQSKDVIVVCSGWRGRPSLEDTLFAGAFATSIGYELEDDSALMAVDLYSSVENLPTVIRNSAHARRLANFDVDKDLDFCAQIDSFDVVPIVTDGVIRL